MKYFVEIEQASDGEWGGYVPDLPGVAVGGYDSVEKARESLRIAIEMHLEGMREDGVPIPEPSHFEVLEVA